MEISKEIIRNLSLELESYHLYTYLQTLELLEEKMNIVMDYGIFIDVIEDLKEEGFLHKNSVIHFSA